MTRGLRQTEEERGRNGDLNSMNTLQNIPLTEEQKNNIIVDGI